MYQKLSEKGDPAIISKHIFYIKLPFNNLLITTYHLKYRCSNTNFTSFDAFAGIDEVTFVSTSIYKQ